MQWLRYISVVLLCMVFTIPRSAVHFVAHIADVVEHYHHHNEHTEVGIIGFIAMHLPGDAHHDTRHHSHHDMPWGHKHCVESFQVLLAPPQQPVTVYAHAPAYYTSPNTLSQPQYYEYNYYKPIWQPPRA